MSIGRPALCLSAAIALAQSALAQTTCPAPAGRLLTVAPGVRIEVVEWSRTGAPLLFLSGLSRSAHAFDEFAPRFADRYRVLGVTRRGWGRSSQPAGGYDSATLVGDIVAVMDSLGLVSAHVVGWSYGGNEAVWLAVRHPERVRSVTLLDAYDNSLIAGTFADSDTMTAPESPPPPAPATLHEALEAERRSEA